MSDGTFRLLQDGAEVARVDAPTFMSGFWEISHYAMMYGQDGPVDIQMKKDGDWWDVKFETEE